MSIGQNRPAAPSVRSLEGVFSRKRGWRNQNKQPALWPRESGKHLGTHLLSSGPPCPHDPHWASVRTGKFILEAKGGKLSAVTRSQWARAGDTKPRACGQKNLSLEPVPVGHKGQAAPPRLLV